MQNLRLVPEYVIRRRAMSRFSVAISWHDINPAAPLRALHHNPTASILTRLMFIIEVKLDTHPFHQVECGACIDPGLSPCDIKSRQPCRNVSPSTHRPSDSRSILSIHASCSPPQLPSEFLFFWCSFQSNIRSETFQAGWLGLLLIGKASWQKG